MATRFRADNIGSLLRPPDLLQARAALREGSMDAKQVREIEDRAILTALDMQKAAGVQIFTDGEYRRDIFTADLTLAMDGLVPGKPLIKFEWRGQGKELAEQSQEGNLQYVVGGKLRRKGRFTPNEAPFLRQHAPGPRAGGDAGGSGPRAGKRLGAAVQHPHLGDSPPVHGGHLEQVWRHPDPVPHAGQPAELAEETLTHTDLVTASMGAGQENGL